MCRVRHPVWLDVSEPSRPWETLKQEKLITVDGLLLVSRGEDGKVAINGANVLKTDIVCGNGVIHVIDAVILPPG